MYGWLEWAPVAFLWEDTASEGMELIVPWVLPPLILMIGIAAGYGLHAWLCRALARDAHRRAEDVLRSAREQAAAAVRQARSEARLVAHDAREAAEKEMRERRRELERFEERLMQRDGRVEQRSAMLDKKEALLGSQRADLEQQQADLEGRRQELDRQIGALQKQIEQAAAMTVEEARRMLLQRTEEEARASMDHLLKKLLEETRRDADRQAREIIVQAIERCAVPQAGEVTTCSVSLPSDEMKGRIIGRDGRNIRSLEAETGCNFLIDDTPEVVVISGFDPMRREIARRTLERLIADGRIHPARIEEVAAAVKDEVETIVQETGESALAELRLTGVAPELARTVGMLKFRHSFMQNVLQHSIETAHLMGLMAAEIGLDATLARRVGLFHDIGKALDHRLEGNHAAVGAEFLKRCGEAPIVWQAVGAHHHEAEDENIYAVLAAAADAITAARPGARSETTDLYLKRLEQLEAIANRHEGVKTSYAVYAGRELRVIVTPEQVDDHRAMTLARDISREIEEQIRYPGQIRVTVIRETRCVEYAR